MKNKWLQENHTREFNERLNKNGFPTDTENSIQCIYPHQFVQNEKQKIKTMSDTQLEKMGKKNLKRGWYLYTIAQFTPVLKGTMTGTIKSSHMNMATFAVTEGGDFEIRRCPECFFTFDVRSGSQIINQNDCILECMTGEILIPWSNNFIPDAEYELILSYEYHYEICERDLK